MRAHEGKATRHPPFHLFLLLFTERRRRSIFRKLVLLGAVEPRARHEVRRSGSTSLGGCVAFLANCSSHQRFGPWVIS
jgi:hypothetical protein